MGIHPIGRPQYPDLKFKEFWQTLKCVYQHVLQVECELLKARLVLLSTYLLEKMTILSKFRVSASFAAVGVVIGLTACGGGGDDGAGSNTQTVTGTAARGAALSGATVSMTCANNAVLTGVTNATGAYSASATTIVYPCIGTAVAAGGSPVYRSILFSGAVTNFTPLTDMLVQAVLAAAVAGPNSLSAADFLAKVAGDTTFAASVSSPASVATYRAAVLSNIRTALAATKTPAQIDAIIATAATFDTTLFVPGSALDQVLDSTAAVLQNADGTVNAAVLAAVKASGDTLSAPVSKATGATGS